MRDEVGTPEAIESADIGTELSLEEQLEAWRARCDALEADLAAAQADVARYKSIATRPAPARKRFDGEAFGNRIFELVRRYVDPVKTNHAALVKRLEALEQKALSYRGVWRHGESYQRNTIVTHAGVAWLAHKDTDSKPGGGDVAWQMIVKSK